MLTSLTSWLRPSSDRRRKAARLRAVEHLEDRTVPNSNPHSLLAGAFTQNWASAAVISNPDDWSGAASIVGFGGTGLGLSAGANPTGVLVTNTGPQQVTANLNAPTEDITSSGIAEYENFGGVVAFRPDGTNQAPNLVIHLNTSGVNNTRVQFNVVDINPAPRDAVQQLAVQYRIVGTDATFLNVPGGYLADVTTSGTATTPVSVFLPTRADNLPAGTTVQVRILATQAAGDNEWFGIDDINISANRQPAVTLLGPTAAWTEGSTSTGPNPPVLIAPTVPNPIPPDTVTDADSPANLNGGSLTVTVTNPQSPAQDDLTVNFQGTTAGQFSSSGSTVLYAVTTGNTIPIGTFGGGTGGAPLVVNFNTNANLTIVSALVRQITYNNSSQDPNTTTRVISFVVRDGQGGTSTAVTKNVTLTAINDIPTADAGLPQTLLEDATVSLTGLVFDDVDVRTAVMRLTLMLPANSGALQLRTNVPGGVLAGQVTANGTGLITIDAPLAAINNTLAATNGLVYTPAPNFNTELSPSVLLTLNITDNGNTPGPARDATATKAITVTGLNDAPVAFSTGVVATLPVSSAMLPFTLANTPPGGMLLPTDIVGVTTAAGVAVSLAGASLTGSGTGYTLIFPAALAAGSYRVTVRASTVQTPPTVDLLAASPTLAIVLNSVPPAGTLTLANIFRVTNTSGAPIDLTGVVVSGAGLNYTLTFPSNLPIGSYTVTVVLPVQALDYPLASPSAAMLVAPNGFLSEVDFPKSPNLNGGRLTVQVFTNGVASGDHLLRVRNQGFAVGQIGLQGSNITYRFAGSPAADIIGRFSTIPPGSGTGSIPLIVEFNSDAATPEAVQALLRNVTLQITSFDNTMRVVRFNITDGDGPNQQIAEVNPAPVLYADFDTFLVVNPQPINNAPSFTVPAALAAVLEDAGAQSAANFATSISPGPATYESGQVLTFQVTNNTNPGLFSAPPALSSAGTLTFTPAANANGFADITVRLMDDGGTANGGDDTSDTQTFRITVTAVNDAPSFTVPSMLAAVNEDAGPQTEAAFATSISPGPGPSEAGQLLTFLVSNDNTALFSAQPMISPSGTLTFTPAANASGTATVTVRLMDDGGTANLGVDTSAPLTFTITVNAVNDDPVLGGVVSPVPYLVGQPGTPVLGGGTVTDDSADFDGGVLTVSYTSGSTGNETLAVQGGVGAVGMASGGASGTALTITFNATATRAAVEAVLRNVVFSTPNTAVAGDRVLSVVLTDGDGGTSTPPTAVTVRVADQVTALTLAKTDPASPVAGPTLTWRLTTDLPVTGFTAGNFALSGTIAASVTAPLNVVQINPTTYEITATLTAAVQGTLGLNLVNETGLSVGIANVDAGAMPPVVFPGGTANQYAVDRVGPTVTLVTNNDAGGDNIVPVNQAVTYTVTFSEDVPDGTFDLADLGTAGSAPVSFGTIVRTGPRTFTVPVTPSAAGTIRLQLLANAVVTDALGNDDPGAYLDPVTLAVDAVLPTVVSFSNITNSTPQNSFPPNVTAPGTSVTYTVTFSEDIDAATLAGSFSNVGTAPATVGTATEPGTPGVVTVTLTPTGTGTLQLRVFGVRDVAGNEMVADSDDTVVTSNLPPTPQNDSYSLPEDGGIFTSPARGVLANDTDPNDAPLTLTADTPAILLPAKGTLVLRSDGTFDYTPALNATGADSFQYRVRDPFGGTATATVNLTITPVNDAPTFTVNVPTVNVLEDSGTSSGVVVLTNILPGPAGETEDIASIGATTAQSNFFSVQPRVQLVRNPSTGEQTGVLTFTPAPNQFGTATVTVTVTDVGSGLTPNVNARSQQFTIVIAPVNDAPTLVLNGNPPVSAEDGGTQSVTGFASFLPGPNEGPLGQSASYTATVTGTSGGLTFSQAPVIDANGTLTYRAAPDSTGTATVQVSVRDSGGTANGGADAGLFTQQFTIVVRSQNDLPIARPDAGLVPRDAGPTFIDTLTNDSPDPDGSEVLTVVSVTPPANGTAAVAPGGRGVLYTPKPGFSGTDTFTYTINDGNGGPATSTVTVTVRPVPAGQPLFDVVATGTGPGGGPVVRVNSLSTGSFTATFAAYDPGFRGGVNVAVGDVNGDGVPDVVVTPGFGGGPHVKVVDGTKLGLVDERGFISEAAVLASFFAYSPTFTGGVTVVVADMDGDGRADIITGTGPGGGAHVKVISARALTQFGNLGDGQVNPRALLASFFAYAPPFSGGVNVAAGDVDGDGRADIITASGAGGGSHVKVFSGLGGPLLQSYFAYGDNFRGGVNIAAGDVNGDGLADIITGAGVGGGPHVKVFDARGGNLASFFALTGSAAGADVAYRVTKGGTPLVVVGGQSGGSQVRTYAAPNFDLFSAFDAYEPTFLGGVEVG